MLFLVQGRAAPGKGRNIFGPVGRANAPELDQAKFLRIIGNTEELNLGRCQDGGVYAVAAQNHLHRGYLALRRLR
ncbi:hypothetical protein VCV18_005771 [Metarhizium anisopliae]